VKITIELDVTPDEFKELFVPSERQQEFVEVTYNAYAEALRKLVLKQIDPYDFTGMQNK
jgi:hypothetical protein